MINCARCPCHPVETIAIAKQIVEALEEAHERGIVHRDLKPAKIKVRPDGKIKVLDFGVAKASAVERVRFPPPAANRTATNATLARKFSCIQTGNRRISIARPVVRNAFDVATMRKNYAGGRTCEA